MFTKENTNLQRKTWKKYSINFICCQHLSFRNENNAEAMISKCAVFLSESSYIYTETLLSTTCDLEKTQDHKMFICEVNLCFDNIKYKKKHQCIATICLENGIYRCQITYFSLQFRTNVKVTLLWHNIVLWCHCLLKLKAYIQLIVLNTNE